MNNTELANLLIEKKKKDLKRQLEIDRIVQISQIEDLLLFPKGFLWWKKCPECNNKLKKTTYYNIHYYNIYNYIKYYKCNKCDYEYAIMRKQGIH